MAAQHDRQRLAGHTGRDEGQHVEAELIEPLGVVHCAQYGSVGRRRPEQLKHGQAQTEPPGLDDAVGQGAAESRRQGRSQLIEVAGDRAGPAGGPRRTATRPPGPGRRWSGR